MTLWGPVPIAAFARGAGFRGEALHDAVALALAASGGADHYSHNVISAPGAERRGLWATRLDETPNGEWVDLFDPVDAARVAHSLWEASSRSFDFHPVWITGAATPHRAYVPTALARVDATARTGSGVTYNEHLAQLLALSEAWQRRIDTGRLFGD